MRSLKSTLLAGVLASTLPLTLATTAEASTSRDGCTVTPKAPVVTGVHTNGQKVARYDVSIRCTGNRTISVVTEAYEQDNGKPGDAGGDDRMVRYAYSPISVPSSGGTYTRAIYWTVPDWDTDDWVELYQRVTFQVKAGGVSGSWTPWEKSGVTNVFV